MAEATEIDAVFAALAHPTRRAILARLAEGEASVTTLAEPFEMSLPAISRHIKVLEDAKLITRSRTAQFRPCRLNPATLREVAQWADHYRPIWDLRFDAMDRALADRKDRKEAPDD